MKKGVIIINAYSQLEASLYQSKRLKEEFAKMGVEIDVFRNNRFFTTIEQSEIINSLLKYDFCIYLDKDKYVSGMLEKSGMRLFNRHQSIRDCDDKMDTYVRLANHGIPMPKTMPGLLCYTPDQRVKAVSLDALEDNLGYPMIIKESYGSLGKGVYKAENRQELERYANRLIGGPHLFQEFITTSMGKDIRVIIIGGKFIGCMLRHSRGDFRSNIELGGQGSVIQVPEFLIERCKKIASIMELDYCGIDILFGSDGEFILCEVNSNAFFGGIESVTGINVAKAYASYVYEQMYK